jgi:hypothetical protein
VQAGVAGTVPKEVVRLALAGVLLGLVATGVAGALPGSQGLNALTWLATTATLAALVVAIGIYRLQQEAHGRAHEQLLAQLDAYQTLVRDFIEAAQQGERVEEEPDPLAALTEDQRRAIEEEFGPDTIAAAWMVGQGRGNRPRLVRLHDGRIVSVYSGGRVGGTYVRAVELSRKAST